MNIIRQKSSNTVVWLGDDPVYGVDGVFASNGAKLGISEAEHELVEGPAPNQVFFPQCMTFDGAAWAVSDQDWYDRCWSGYCAEHNAKQKELRAAAYMRETDPIFFKYQRGEATQGEWAVAVASVKARFPYIGVPVAAEPTVEGAQTL